MPPQILTSEGTVIVPIEVQKKLGIKAGDRVNFVENERGETVIKPEFAPQRKARSIMELSGIGKWEGPPVTIEEMNETIRKGWAGLLKDDEVER